MANTEPIVVLLKSKDCGHCKMLETIWGKETDRENTTILGAMKKVYPNLRIFVVSLEKSSGFFNENVIPSGLSRWTRWFPMILLVPGRVWDNSMAKLGPKNPATIIDGVQVFNGRSQPTGQIEYVQKYNPRKPEDFGRWLTEALDNDEFKKHQYSNDAIVQHTATTTTGLTVPVLPSITTTTTAIKPLMKDIVSTAPSSAITSRAYVAAGPFDYNGVSDDVCNMRLITRPK